MKFNFFKMHSLGNDFMVFDATHQTFNLTPAQIARLADRHRGIGFDQLLVLSPAQNPTVDFNYRIFNANGLEVEQCGNGARCIARFIHDRNLSKKNELILSTLTRQIKIKFEANHLVSVDMGQPIFEPDRIPFIAEAMAPRYLLEIGDEVIGIRAVNIGNPHAVMAVEDVNTANVARLGPLIERHPRFPKGVNVSFMQIVNSNHIKLRVFERGVGETLACGSAACAAVAVGRHQGLLTDSVSVELPGGKLTIAWPDQQRSLLMTGPAEWSYSGEWLGIL